MAVSPAPYRHINAAVRSSHGSSASERRENGFTMVCPATLAPATLATSTRSGSCAAGMPNDGRRIVTEDAPFDGDYVQSLERGLSVIRAFDADHPKLTLSEVATATGMSRAAAR